jgi:hypothetical protein
MLHVTAPSSRVNQTVAFAILRSLAAIATEQKPQILRSAVCFTHVCCVESRTFFPAGVPYFFFLSPRCVVMLNVPRFSASLLNIPAGFGNIWHS